jgi:hypothetical protein
MALGQSEPSIVVQADFRHAGNLVLDGSEARPGMPMQTVRARSPKRVPGRPESLVKPKNFSKQCVDCKHPADQGLLLVLWSSGWSAPVSCYLQGDFEHGQEADETTS